MIAWSGVCCRMKEYAAGPVSRADGEVFVMHIEHIVMYVRDLEKSKAFFVRYFSAAANELYHNKATDFRSYFLSFDGGARLEIMTKPHLTAEESSAYRAGYSHIAFSLGSRAAVEALTERLRADGYTVVSGPRTTGRTACALVNRRNRRQSN